MTAPHVFSTKQAGGSRWHSSSPPQPLPPFPGVSPYRLNLDSVSKLGPDAYRFHMVGDVGGVKTPTYQQAVAAGMAADPAGFAYIVGDVAYYNGERSVYHDQFYEPYAALNWPIFAIPGNHDGDPISGDYSLDGFMANFCQPQPGMSLPEAGEYPRTAMTQPGPYWTLDTPLVTIIGLYTNVPEGGYVDDAQQTWLLAEIEAADPDKFLIVALHHPLYSADAYHSGSAAMQLVVSGAESQAGRKADLIVTGHVHDYQRWHDKDNRVQVVAGAGGYYNLHHVSQAPGYVDSPTGATLDAAVDDVHGYLSIMAAPTTLAATYYGCPPGAAPIVRDTFTILKGATS